MVRKVLTALALASAFPLAAGAQDFAEFSTRGHPGSYGMVLRVSHPQAWKKVAPDDPLALAELRGPHGPLTGILQIARGRRRSDMESLCTPERARTMLQNTSGDEADARVTDVLARKHEGRPAFDLRYERNQAPDFLLVRSVIVCLKDTRVVVSCGAMGATKAAVSEIEAVCSRVLESLAISED